MPPLEDPANPVLLPAGGERVTLLGMGVRTVYVHELGACSVVEFTVPGGTAQPPPPHRHRRTEEVFFVVRGALHVRVGGTAMRAEERATVRVPPGTPHTFWNPDEGEVTFLATCVPAGAEAFFVELATRLAAGDGTPAEGRRIRDELARTYDVVYDADA